VSHLAAPFEDHTVGAVAGTVRAINDGNLLGIFQSIEYTVGQFMEKQAFNRIFHSIGIVPGAIGAWRKSDLEAVGRYSSDTLAEDQDLTLSVHTLGKTVFYEDRAIAFTEVPNTLATFLYQRSRWIFGSIQCLWKYHRFFLSWRYPQLGFAILPFNLIFATLLTVVAPLVDILFLYHLFFGVSPVLFGVLMLFLLIDVTYVGVCLIRERQPLWHLLLVPLQRVFYRFVISIIMIGAIVKAIEGRRVLWGGQVRFGAARDFFGHVLTKPVARKV